MLYAILAMIVLIIDQAVKYWTNLNLAVLESKPLIPSLIELTHTHNNGAAYGLFSEANARWVFVALTVAFTIAVIILISKNVLESSGGNVLLTLVMAGGVGNGIDRVINGYVVDMFHFQFNIFGYDFPVFNVADIFITVGGILFCLWLIFHKSAEPKTPPPKRTRPMPKANERPKRGPDYIEQLAKPVTEAKAALENTESEQAQDSFPKTERASLPKDRAELMKAHLPFKTVPTAPIETAPESDSEVKETPQADPNDPFAEFLSKPLIHKETSASDNTKAPAEPAASPKAAVPSSKDEFSLESIMAEFKE